MTKTWCLKYICCGGIMSWSVFEYCVIVVRLVLSFTYMILVSTMTFVGGFMCYERRNSAVGVIFFVLFTAIYLLLDTVAFNCLCCRSACDEDGGMSTNRSCLYILVKYTSAVFPILFTTVNFLCLIFNRTHEELMFNRYWIDVLYMIISVGMLSCLLPILCLVLCILAVECCKDCRGFQTNYYKDQIMNYNKKNQLNAAEDEFTSLVDDEMRKRKLDD